MRSLFIAFIFIANSALAQDSVKISGTIAHSTSDSIEISYNSNYIAYYPNEYFAHVSKAGKFSFVFPVPHGVYTQASIRYADNVAELMLQPGDSLTITADAAHFDSTIHYKGRGSEIANFIALHATEIGVMNKYTVAVREFIYKEPADFLKGIAGEQKKERDFLNRHKAGLPVSFINFWEAYYRYYNYFFMQQYPQIHELLKLRRYTDTIPMQNYDVVKDMPYAFNDSLLQVPSYMLYLTGVFDIKLKAAGYTYFRGDTEKMRESDDSVYALGYKLMPTKSAEYFIAQNIYGRAKHQPVERTLEQFSKFKQHWPHSDYTPMLEKQVAIAERLAPGMPAPDIDIKTQDGKSMKLSALKGKVVYLDFWASWCRQCVGEIVNERKIKMLTAGKPLEFVYVSIDEDTVTDNKIINKYKISGLFTNAAGGWNSTEAQLYGVQGLPAYFLIDEDGKIAAQDAATPMNPTELVLEIEKLFR